MAEARGALSIGLQSMGGAWGHGGGLPWLTKRMGLWQRPVGSARRIAQAPLNTNQEGTILVWHAAAIAEAHDTHSS